MGRFWRLNLFKVISFKKLVIILKKDLFKDLSWVLSSNIINKLGTLFLYFLLAKVLSVEKYGLIVILFSLTHTIASFSNLGFTASITKFSAIFNQQNESTKLKHYFSTVTINILLLSLIFGLLFYIFSNQIALYLLKSQESQKLIIYAILGVPCMLVFMAYSALFSGIQKFKTFFWIRIIPTFVLLFGVVVVLLFAKENLKLILFIFAIHPLSAILVIFIQTGKLQYLGLNYSIEILKETFSFSKWVSLLSIVLIFQLRLDTYLLAYLTNPEEVSYYDIGFKIKSVLLFLFGSISSVILPKISAKQNIDEIKIYSDRIKNISVLLSIFVLFLTPVASYGVLYFFEEKYAPSFYIIIVMTIAVIPYVWIYPYSSALFALGKSKDIFFIVLITLIVNITCSIILIPKFNALGAGISYLFVSITAFLSNYLFYKKHFSILHSKNIK